MKNTAAGNAAFRRRAICSKGIFTDGISDEGIVNGHAATREAAAS
jgi:hypothetical protein